MTIYFKTAWAPVTGFEVVQSNHLSFGHERGNVGNVEPTENMRYIFDDQSNLTPATIFTLGNYHNINTS